MYIQYSTELCGIHMQYPTEFINTGIWNTYLKLKWVIWITIQYITESISEITILPKWVMWNAYSIPNWATVCEIPIQYPTELCEIPIKYSIELCVIPLQYSTELCVIPLQ